MDTQLNAALTQALNGVRYDALRARVAAMSARYRAEQVDNTTLGMADDLDCLAYAVFRMPATYHAIRAALRAVDTDVTTHLDLGGGTGAAAWAAAELWPPITTEIVEPGTPRGFRRILEVRRQLIQRGLTIAAPCPHAHSCPLSTSDWCHFAVRLPRTELHRLSKDGTRNYEDEKFTYLVATRAPVQPAAARIITRPTRPKGQVVLDLCVATGARQRLIVSKASKEAYRRACSASWGDAWVPKDRM